MTDNVGEPTRNAFLCLLEKMAGDRKQSLEEFAETFHYTPQGIQMLRESPWLNPSEAIIDLLQDEIELTEDEDWDLQELLMASLEQEIEVEKNELIRIYELLPIGYCTTIMEVARKQMEIFFCFEGHEIPKPSSDPEYYPEEE